MTDKEEVLDWLYRIRSCVEIYFPYRWINKCQEALDMATKALEQEPILDKIRAEILQMPTISLNANDIYKADVLAIIDKYKSESEE